MLFDIQNAKFDKEMQKLAKEKERTVKQRIQRLKYLYRKRTKGVAINLRTINKANSEDPREGQFKRIRQYEHYICKKIGFISQRRDLLNQADHPDPTKRFQSLKTTIQEEEEEELKNLVEYFDQQNDDNRNELTAKVNMLLGNRNKSVDSGKKYQSIDPVQEENQDFTSVFETSRKNSLNGNRKKVTKKNRQVMGRGKNMKNKTLYKLPIKYNPSSYKTPIKEERLVSAL